MTDYIQKTITWIPVHKGLPPKDEVVRIFRVGGKNNHNDVYYGKRVRDPQSPFGWEWLNSEDRNAWSISVDGSDVLYWTPDELEPPLPPMARIG